MLFAQDSPPITEQITLFRSDIEQFENTDINIREEIHYYFPSYKHGIIREIPIDYKVQAGFKRPTTLTLNEIYYYPKDFPERKFTQYERSSKSGYAIFKIGDPESTIQGEYVYVIDYTLKNAVNYFDEYDELYLNITGNGWSVPIIQAVSNIKVPGSITDKICYTGLAGSTESNCTFEQVNDTEINLSSNTLLGNLEGLTVAVKMPKGTLEDTSRRQLFALLIANIGILLPIPTFIFLSGIVKKKGKNKKITVFPHYEPEKGMYPILGGYIYSKALNNKHITAEIIQLAIDGHIKIKQEGKRDYILAKDNVDKEISLEIPRTLYSGLFKKGDEVNTKKISSDFYLTVRSLNTSLNKEVYAEEYFSTERRNLKGKLVLAGVLGIFLFFFTIAQLSYIAATGWGIGLLISSILSLIFAFQVDIRADRGNKAYYELEGLKMYINTAEKHRIEFHNDPEKFRGVFEMLLPYAIIFGLEKKWANEFKDIYKEPPSWYEGDMRAFNSYVLANSIAGISKNVQARSAPPNSAGGFSSSHGASGGSGFSGGSSGGGFGGGGGSSW
jgi:uncharacterized membrane protein YgcG